MPASPLPVGCPPTSTAWACYSSCGLWSRGMAIVWERVRNVLWPHPRPAFELGPWVMWIPCVKFGAYALVETGPSVLLSWEAIAVSFKLRRMCVLTCLLPLLSLSLHSSESWRRQRHGHLPWCPCGHSLTVHRGDLPIQDRWRRGSSTGAGRDPPFSSILVSGHLYFSIPSTLKRPTDEIDETDAEFTGPRLGGDEWSGCCFQPCFILKQE